MTRFNLFTVAPVIWLANKVVKATIGQDLQLYCHVDAFPLPQNYWIRKDGQVIDPNNDERYRVTKEEKDLYKTLFTLVIYNVKSSDFGVYSCYANNSVGSKEDSLHIVGEFLKPFIRHLFRIHLHFGLRWYRFPPTKSAND